MEPGVESRLARIACNIDRGQIQLEEPPAGAVGSRPLAALSKTKLKLPQVAPHKSSGGPLHPNHSTVRPTVGKGLGVGAKQPPGKTKDRMNTSRSFVRLLDPDSKLTFLREHPFFQGVSAALHERLAPQLVRRSQEKKDTNHGLGEELVLEAGGTPTANTEYLFLTGPESHTRLQVVFDGQTIATLGDCSVFGQESIFNITKAFVFSISIASGSANSLWVIPRSVLQNLLHKEAFRKDAKLLRQRAEELTVETLQKWYLSPCSHVRLRLFENADHQFKMALIKQMSLSLHLAGSKIRLDGVEVDSCFCVFQGEAHVFVRGDYVAKLAHVNGSSAWAAWWGLLEALGVCRTSPAEVSATTDVFVWNLSPDSLKLLRKSYPMECRLFDMVAKEHARMLQPMALSVRRAPVFNESNAAFLDGLTSIVERRVCAAGQTLYEQNDCGTEMYYLARGSVNLFKMDCKVQVGRRSSVLRKDSMAEAYADSVIEDSLVEGSFFGEQVALGCEKIRETLAMCKTICDLRVLDGSKVVRLLERWPSEAMVFVSLLREGGYGDIDEVLGQPLENTHLFKAFSNSVVYWLAKETVSQVAFHGQEVVKQGSEQKWFYILIMGSVVAEIDGVRSAELHAPSTLGDESVVELSMEKKAAPSEYAFSVRCEGCCVFRVAEALAVAEQLRSPEDRSKFVELSHRMRDQLKLQLSDDIGKLPSIAIYDTGFGPGVTPAIDGNGANVSSADILVEMMKTSELFSESSGEFLRLLTKHMQAVDYVVGQILFREGEDGDFAVFVESGECLVEVGGTRVGEVRSGGIVGEAAAFHVTPKRSATVTAQSPVRAHIMPSKLVTITKDIFPQEMARLKEIAHRREGVRQCLKLHQPGIQASSPSPTTGGARLLGGLLQPSATTARRSWASGHQARLGTAGTRLSARRFTAARGSFAAAGTRRSVGFIGSASCAESRMRTPDRLQDAPSPVWRFDLLSSRSSSESSNSDNYASVEHSLVCRQVSPTPDAVRFGLSQVIAKCEELAHLDSDSDEDLDVKGKCFPPYTEWARKRQMAIELAPRWRQRGLVRAHRLAPLVPHDRGYQPGPQARFQPIGLRPWSVKSSSEDERGAAPGYLRFKMVKGIYGKKVWAG